MSTCLQNKYYMLMASLPRLEKNFHPDVRIPVDRDTLFLRLKELKENDKQEMEILFSHTTKLHYPLKLTDQEIIGLFEDTLSKLHAQFIKDMLISGLTLRLALYVFRKRKLGEIPVFPLSTIDIVRHVKDNIDHPDLKLASRIPQIAEIRETLNTGDVLDIEKKIDEYKWNLSTKIGEGEFFTFKSFISYFIKWDILYRWSRIDRKTGLMSFENILGEVQRYEY